MPGKFWSSGARQRLVVFYWSDIFLLVSKRSLRFSLCGHVVLPVSSDIHNSNMPHHYDNCLLTSQFPLTKVTNRKRRWFQCLHRVTDLWGHERESREGDLPHTPSLSHGARRTDWPILAEQQLSRSVCVRAFTPPQREKSTPLLTQKFLCLCIFGPVQHIRVSLLMYCSSLGKHGRV